jgi:hypothetical protein
LLTPDGRTLLEERASMLRDDTIPTLQAAVVDGHRHDWSPQPDLDRARAELVAIETTLRESGALPAVSVPWTVELGDAVTVELIEQPSETRIIAVCRRGKARQAIDLLDLPLPSPPPTGTEWIEAYRHWRSRW